MPTINQLRCGTLFSCPYHGSSSPIGSPPQRHRHNCHSWKYDMCNAKWLRRRAGGAAADDHNVHDRRIECALLYRRHAFGAEGLHRFRTSHPCREHPCGSPRALPARRQCCHTVRCQQCGACLDPRHKQYPASLAGVTRIGNGSYVD
jgi:hypothetical protein